MAIRQDRQQREGWQIAPAWHPLRHRVFRALWIATFFSNIGTWMQEVGGAWLMTTLSPTPLMVALMQVATSLPMDLLALQAGTHADVVDRRRLLLVTQSVLCLTAICFGVVVGLDAMTSWSLLGLTGIMSLGLALNAPARRAITPELVTRDDLSAAISLKNASINVARAVGPALGGLLMTAVGPAALFFLNALSFLSVIAVFFAWRREPTPTRLPAEHFWGAMQAGVRYVRHAPEIWAVLARAGLFTLCGSALWALLPLFARTKLGLDATGYGLLLGCFGVGAIAGTMVLPWLRQRLVSERLVAGATLVFAAVLLAVAGLRLSAILCGVMIAGGFAWLTLLSIFSASMHAALPSWVRGRALAI
jgi:MFS family permease